MEIKTDMVYLKKNYDKSKKLILAYNTFLILPQGSN